MGFCWDPSLRGANSADLTSSLDNIIPSDSLTHCLHGYVLEDLLPAIDTNNLPSLVQQSKQFLLVRAAYAIDKYNKKVADPTLQDSRAYLRYKDPSAKESATSVVAYIAILNSTINAFAASGSSVNISKIMVIYARGHSLSVTKEIYDAFPTTEYANLEASLKIKPSHYVHVTNVNGVWVILTNAAGPGIWLRLLTVLGYMSPAHVFLDTEWQELLIKDDLVGFINKVEQFIKAYNAERWLRQKKEMTQNISAMGVRVFQDRLTALVKDTSDSLTRYYAECRSLEALLMARQKDLFAYLYGADKNNNALSNLATYLMLKKQIVRVIPYTSNMTQFGLVCSLPCANFDPKAVQNLINNKSLRDCNKHTRVALSRIFVEQVHFLWLTCNIVVNLMDSTISKKNTDLAPVGIPNPHLYHFTCFGTNLNPIIKALQEQNYEVAVEQMLSSAAGINFYDGTVVGKLLESLMNSRSSGTAYEQKCVALAPDTAPTLTWDEYILYLINEEEEKTKAVEVIPITPLAEELIPEMPEELRGTGT